MTTEVKYNLGEHVMIEGVRWLPVRYVDSTTLFETADGRVYVENELYVELRSAEGVARFVQLAVKAEPARRDPGPIKGIKPYFWKEAK